MELRFIDERVRDIAKRVTDVGNLELVHTEIAGTKRNPVLRVFIDKPDGVTIEDCASVSHDMEAVLDAEDFIPSKYVLEVSSPGLERELYGLKDFERFTGKLAKVKTSSEINGSKNFVGIIAGIEGQTILIDDRSSGHINIPIEAVSKAHLKIDLDAEFRKRQPKGTRVEGI